MTRLITDWREALEVFSGATRETPIALDLETTGLSPWLDSIAVVGIYDEVTDCCAALHFPRTDYQRMTGEKLKLPRELVEWLSDPDRFFVAHNACGFDFYFLWEAGVDIFAGEWYDTMIGEGVVVKAARRDVRVRLKDAYKRQLGKDLKKEINHETWQNPTLTLDQLAYVQADIVYLQELRRVQLGKVKEDSRAKAMALEQELMMVVARMIINGLPIDKEAFRNYIGLMSGFREQYEKKAKGFANRQHLNLNSPKQLLEVFEELGYPQPKTDIATLTRIRDADCGDASEFAGAVLEYRLCKTRVNMYNDAFFDKSVLPADNGHVVRARYWQVGTDTGRFSSSDPNLQQVAGDCRTFFGRIGDSHCATLDYSQLEVRIAAWLAKDEVLLDALDAEDVHAAVAAQIFGVSVEQITPEQRKLAKAGTFTFLFGGGYTLFQETARSQGSVMTLLEAKNFEATFFERFTGLAAARNSARYVAKHRPSVNVTMPHGLIRTLAGPNLKATTLLNSCVQGGAASGLKKAMLYCRDFGVHKYLAGTVHDEFIQVAHMRILGDGSETPQPGQSPDGQVVALTRLAMELGMLWAFPNKLNDQAFPVKVGVNILPHWSGPPPHTQESIEKKAGKHGTNRIPGSTGPTTNEQE